MYHDFHLPALFLAVVCLLRPGIVAAQLSTPSQEGQSWTDVGVGIGMGNGSLEFQGRQYEILPPDMKLETALTAYPQAALLLRHWVNRSFGFRVGGQLGYLPGLELPTQLVTTKDGQAASLRFMGKELQAALLFRLHLSASATSPALQGELGFQLLGYAIQEQEPALLVSTTYVGPTLGLGVHLPLGQQLALLAGGGLFVPVYLLEEPVDSGRLERSWAYQVGLSAEYQLTPSIMLELAVRRVAIHTTFDEHGTRGVSGHGIFDAESQEAFNQVGLNARYRL